MTNEKLRDMSFEATLEELDTLVHELENGNLTLDNALKKFEYGIYLAREGQNKLADVEQRVKILLQNNDENPRLIDFNSNTE
ncbi:Exodeoxyribonuclease 7 small subunit [Candidatus Photodesmus blepharus]|uniref:Exodeoxyribonuclease 7 small subunit n=1 Tax=Candidatus Photodesmus blepharonis TaxID=1179155 RepID=A0A084CPH9_9GAMM|nr:exodeoxyribonuclease VII small subunit [Candidatus Photodesmus blepharus]KEY91708.1 Exodeoxyribonuclease 7 small subunit [Candidatus Photodesmus blepharus]